MTKIKPVTPSHSLPEKFLGYTPEDIASIVKIGADTVGQLDWLLKAIKRLLADDYQGHHALQLVEVRRVADIALQIAYYQGGLLDDHSEDLQKALNDLNVRGRP